MPGADKMIVGFPKETKLAFAEALCLPCTPVEAASLAEAA